MNISSIAHIECNKEIERLKQANAELVTKNEELKMDLESKDEEIQKLQDEIVELKSKE